MSNEFENEVMLKLGRLEAGLASLTKTLEGNGQPGFITKTNQRLVELERTDYRRGWIEHAITVVVATVISAAIAMHDHFFK